jgi:tetratricopeptide (TPR) repeat protein
MTLLAIALTLTVAAALAALVLSRRLRGGAESVGKSAVLIKHPAAFTTFAAGEVVIALPGQVQGLALNAVAARCWELMDGTRTALSVARIVASEYGVPGSEGLREVRAFARRIKEATLALEAREWNLVHIHLHDVFAGSVLGDAGAIVEHRLSENLIVHAASCLVAPGGSIEPWRGGGRERRAAAAAMASHRGREAVLEEAAREFQSGWDLCAAGRLSEAEAAFRRCTDRAPDWANAHYQLGYVLLRSKRYEEAGRSLERTEALVPGHYMVREYIDQARRLAAGQLAHEAFALFDRANATGLRDPDTTIRLARRALEINPDFPSARLILARAYHKKALLDMALAELSRTIQMEPDPATLCHALYSRGTIFMAQGLAQEAMREWEKVIEINGSSSATRSALATMAASAAVH